MTINGNKSRVRLILELLITIALAWIAIEALLHHYETKDSLPNTRRAQIYPLILGALAVFGVIAAKFAIIKHFMAPPTKQLEISDETIVVDGRDLSISTIKKIDMWTPRADSSLYTMQLTLANGHVEKALTGRYRLDSTFRELIRQLPSHLDIVVRQPPPLRWLDNLTNKSIKADHS